jgi:hypothetical protein
MLEPNNVTAEVADESVPDQTPAPVAVKPVMDNAYESEDDVLDRLLGTDEPQLKAVSTSSASATDTDFTKAAKALQRDGVPASVIESLDDNALRAWGLKAAKRQADQDEFGRKVAEERKGKQPTETTHPHASVRTDDRESDADPISEFGEFFGEDAAAPLRKLSERLTRDFDEKAKSLELKFQAQSSYQRVSGEYGNKSPDQDTVMEMAAKLGHSRPGEFPSVDALIVESFRLLAGPQKRVDLRDQSRGSAGRPLPRVTREVDRDDLALDVLLAGGNRDDVRKVLSR